MKDSRKKSRSKAAAAPRHGRPIRVAPVPGPAASVPTIAAPAAIAPPAVAPVVQEFGGPRGRVVLGTSCTIQEAAAVRAHLLAQAALPGPYEIDGGSVEMIDTAGVQLIVAFALDCLEKGVPYRWAGRSAALDKAIDLLGVSPLLEYPA